MAHVAEWKKQAVRELTQMMVNNPVIGLVDVHGIPSPQLQKMRKGLRGQADIRVAKKKLITQALVNASGAKKGLESLADHLNGQVGIIASSMNPFMLFKKMEATKTASPAKGGEIAPDDVGVTKGETSFKPGPIVGDLQKAGIPAAIENGKVVIKKDKVLVNKGDKIPSVVAQMLTRLEIYPITVGLDLLITYEDGTIFDKELLRVDDDLIYSQIQQAASGALNLCVFTAFPTATSIQPLLMKGKMEAFNLAMFAGYPTPDTIKLLISKAHGQMFAVALQMDGGLDEELEALKTGAASTPAPAPLAEGGGGTDEKKEKDDDDEEEVSEDEAAAGLGALFG